MPGVHHGVSWLGQTSRTALRYKREGRGKGGGGGLVCLDVLVCTTYVRMCVCIFIRIYVHLVFGIYFFSVFMFAPCAYLCRVLIGRLFVRVTSVFVCFMRLFDLSVLLYFLCFIGR